MRSWSLRLGRLFGIDVFIHWTFWIIILWIFLMHLGADGGFGRGVRGALLVLALFGCVVLHEFGHALTAKRFGVVTRDIALYPIGGISSFESLPEKPLHELLISVAGPSVNVIIAAVLWIYLSLTGSIPDLSALESSAAVELPFLFSLFVANIMLAVFNMIPAFPMDGGRVLRAFLSLFTNRGRATRIAAGIGQMLAILFVFLGFFYNFWLVFIGLFIFLGAGGEAAFERTKAHLAGLKVRDALMRRVTALAPDATLGDASEALLNSQESVFVIADGGSPVGLLTVNDIVRGLAEKGKDAQVSEFMSRDFAIVAPETHLPEFFQKSVHDGSSVAVVMSGGRFEGLIDRENIEEKIMVQQALASRA